MVEVRLGWEQRETSFTSFQPAVLRRKTQVLGLSLRVPVGLRQAVRAGCLGEAQCGESWDTPSGVQGRVGRASVLTGTLCGPACIYTSVAEQISMQMNYLVKASKGRSPQLGHLIGLHRTSATLHFWVGRMAETIRL